MDMETISSLPLTKKQVQNILVEMPIAYGKPTDLCTDSPVLALFSKLGVVVYIDDIAEPKQTIRPRYERYSVNKKLTQTLSCVQCQRVLPTAHLLDLHIIEQHDFYFASSVERGDKPQYSCYVDRCAVKFHVPRERTEHCITQHKFPANYRFDQEKVRKVIKRRDAMDVEVEALTHINESNFPYIKAFTFGHLTQRTFRKYKERKSSMALPDIQDLKIALNDIE